MYIVSFWLSGTWYYRFTFEKHSLPLTMKKKFQFTVVIEREGSGYVSLCPELDIASQGDTVEEAKSKLKEAVGLFYEFASENEINTRFANGNFIVN